MTVLVGKTSPQNTDEKHLIPISDWPQADRFLKGCLCASHLECLSSLSTGYLTRGVQLHLALRFPDHVTLREEQKEDIISAETQNFLPSHSKDRICGKLTGDL